MASYPVPALQLDNLGSLKGYILGGNITPTERDEWFVTAGAPIRINALTTVETSPTRLLNQFDATLTTNKASMAIFTDRLNNVIGDETNTGSEDDLFSQKINTDRTNLIHAVYYLLYQGGSFNLSLATKVPEYDSLPDNLTSDDVGTSFIDESTGMLYIWDGEKFPTKGNGIQFRGENGASATIAPSSDNDIPGGIFTLTITNPDGTTFKTDNLMSTTAGGHSGIDGANGKDAISPTITEVYDPAVNPLDYKIRVETYDPENPTTTKVFTSPNLMGLPGAKGDKGDAGADGISPTIRPSEANSETNFQLVITTGDAITTTDNLMGQNGKDGTPLDVKEVIKNDTTYILEFSGLSGNIISPNLKGDPGKDGKDGTSITILGTYDNIGELNAANPSGNVGDGYLINGFLFVWDNINNQWKDVGNVKGPKGDKGDTGNIGIPGIDGVSPIISTSPLNNPTTFVLDITDASGTKSTTNLMGPRGARGFDGVNGVNGKSAYEIAVDGGFVGSIEQWMLTLKGDKGDDGLQGPAGANGTDGKDGTGVTILGKFNDLTELQTNHPTGAPGSSYLVGSDLYIWSSDTSSWENVGPIQGPKGDTGNAGPKGDPGINGTNGNDGANGINGTNGVDGFSPTIDPSSDNTSEQYSLTITNADGNPFKTINLKGDKGADGVDGFSPFITVNTNTSTEYVLDIITKDGPITTPNLKGLDGTGSAYSMINVDGQTISGAGTVDNPYKVGISAESDNTISNINGLYSKKLNVTVNNLDVIDPSTNTANIDLTTIESDVDLLQETPVIMSADNTRFQAVSVTVVNTGGGYKVNDRLTANNVSFTLKTLPTIGSKILVDNAQYIFDSNPAATGVTVHGGSGTGMIVDVASAYAPGPNITFGKIEHTPEGDPLTQRSIVQSMIDNETAGMKIISSPITLSVSIGGITPIPINSFPVGTVFDGNRTMVYDTNGTTGLFTDYASATSVNIKTVSVSGVSVVSKPLGSVPTFADLPTNTSTLPTGWQTPSSGDTAKVIADETHSEVTYQYTVISIAPNGDITWGSGIPVNVGDYQAKTDVSMSGKVLTGGDTAGTFGTPINIATTVVDGSIDLITGGAVKSFVDTSLSEFVKGYDVTETEVATGNKYRGKPTFKRIFTFTTNSTAQDTVIIDIGLKIDTVVNTSGFVIKNSSPVMIGSTHYNVDHEANTTQVSTLQGSWDLSGTTSTYGVYSDGYENLPGELWIEYTKITE